MDCATCALTIKKYLEKKGSQDVKINFITGDLSFETDEKDTAGLAKGIENIGYTVHTARPADHNGHSHAHAHDAGAAPHEHQVKGWLPFRNNFQQFLFCLVFTLPLMLHMIPGIHLHWLMNPWVQLGLTLPVFIAGMDFFGRSALKGLRQGIANMNVLVALGALSAFAYSLVSLFHDNGGNYLFFETTATIITLVFLGNWLEERSFEVTQAALKKLAVSQKIMANMIAYDQEHNENVFPVENTSLRVGDLVLIRNGEQVPMDCKILWGEAAVNEAIITGESTPVQKQMNDRLVGGSLLESGTIKAYVTAVGNDTVLSHILQLVRDAQAERPPVQQMADRISAIFVPVVLSIAVVTLLGNWLLTDIGFAGSLLRSVAVLVIACPCAMGLATPAAIAVGMGRAARNGVLFRNARSLEVFRNIRQVVFDKTGTLTTGRFTITGFKTSIEPETFKRIAFSLEKFGVHPVAKAVAAEWKQSKEIRWAKVREIKGVGMEAQDKEGNVYRAGSHRSGTFADDTHNIYLTRNGEAIGWIDVADEIRPEARNVVGYLKARGITPILLSGDTQAKCEAVARAVGIDQVIAEQTPDQKLEKIAAFNAVTPTAMIGDGINDAPALAKAAVGISLSDATQVAVQSAQVVLMNNGLENLPLALGLGRHTFITIRQNLFWAFAYNVVAIPVAAFGVLTPTFGALVMGLSDVVLAINSVRLNWKKVA